MQVQLPIFILSFLVHAAIYLTSSKPDRRLRMMAGLALLFNTYPIWFGGQYLEGGTSVAMQWLSLLMVKAPYYFPLLSFLVYIRGKKNSVWK